MEMQKENKRNPKAIFMAFGTKGDVYPIAAIAASFASDQEQYSVIFITHSEHENLRVHLAPRKVVYLPVSSPPVLSPNEYKDSEGSLELSFPLKKMQVTRQHRRECHSTLERIFGDGSSLEGDFVVINFFALEGWSLAELYQVQCAVAAPYVFPYSAPSFFDRRFRKELPLLYEYPQLAPVGKDPVTGLPIWHDRSPSPLLLYGFSGEVV